MAVRIALLALVVAALAGAVFVLMQDAPDVVIYTALDQVHSEPLLLEFEKETGLDVEMLFDVEATKAVGLTNRLVEEKPNPKCDVFWNNEIVNTIRLKREGVLEPYSSPSAVDIPAKWKDPEGFWTAFAARARILIVNEETARRVEPDESGWPASTMDLVAEKWKGRISIAIPDAGTTLTHMSALWAMKGPEFVQNLWRGLYENDAYVAPGNGPVMKLVRDAHTTVDSAERPALVFGYTDTDDFQAALDQGHPVRMVRPDQDPNGEIVGTLLIPNTVSLVKGGPNPENAKRLIDYILSKKVEEALARSSSAQIPVRAAVSRPAHVLSAEEFRTMDVDWERAADALAPFTEWYKEFRQ